jgi:putative addiction module killer protein
VTEAKPRHVYAYEDKGGHEPFTDWIDAFGDTSLAASTIVARIDRVENGNFGDCEPVGKGVFELKIDFGPGYRVYFGQMDDIVVLLNGGDKGTQNADIRKAHALWEEFNSRDDE